MSLPPLPSNPNIWVPQAPNIQRLKDRPLSAQPDKLIKLWRERPWIFYEDQFDVILDDWQREVTESYCKYNRVATVASKGPGKTMLLAISALHFLCTHHLPKCAALSITGDHLKDNLWAEMLLWRSRSPTLIASITDGSSKIGLKGHEQYSFISARSYPKEADESQMASALAGLHANNVAFFIDEAGMIPDAVLATADAALSTGDSDTKKGRILVTANPERPAGMIYRASLGQTEQEWKVHNVTSDPNDPKRAKRVSVKWALEQIKTYGEDHPWVQINVFGKYPRTSDQLLLSEMEIADAMRREIDPETQKSFQCRLGIDVSRGGADSTVFFKRRGKIAYPYEIVSSDVFGAQLASKAMFYARDEGVERVYVDGTGGYGSSVYDHLTTFNSIDCVSVMYNASAHQKNLYANKRTENWVRMRDWVRGGGKIPNDPMLAQELMMPILYFTGGKFQLEPKENIKKRLGRSPDRADALSQTFHDVEDFSSSAQFQNYDADSKLSDVEFMEKWKARHQQSHLADDSQLDKYRRQSNHLS